MSLESPYQTKLIKKPNINEAINNNHISGIEMKIGSAIEYYLKIPIIRQMLIFNPKYPSYPFELDIYVPSKDLGIDVNGRSHKTEKVIERQIRKTPAIEKLTAISQYEQIDVSIPDELFYWNLEGEERERVQKIFEVYSKGLQMEALKIVAKAKDRPTLATPTILKNENNFNRSLERLEELKKK
jgi:hypothetical protein